MIYSRYIALVIFAVLLFVIYNEKTPVKDKVKYIIPFLEGMIGGLVVDSIGVNAGYYYFPRQPLYSMNYFLLVIPCWGLFGLLVNYLWKWVGRDKIWRSIMVTTLPLFAFYEGSNLITHSWVYTVNFYWVVLGWMPLVLVSAGCNRRRRVVWKIDAWVRQCRMEPLWGFKVLATTLIIVRCLLTVVMFPLLISYLTDYVLRHRVMREDDVHLGLYLREMLIMR